MPIEDLNAIDMIVPQGEALALVITDAGLIDKEGDRLALFVQKLALYADYIAADDFPEKHPGFSSADAFVLMMSGSEPTPQMREITSVASPLKPQLEIPVKFQFFPGT